MEKQDSNKVQDIKNQTLETKKLKASRSSNNTKDKNLPWWVELLFVQIGLPDKWLINLLKTKKSAKELYKTEKKILLWGAFFTFSLIYTYPLIKSNLLDRKFFLQIDFLDSFLHISFISFSVIE